MSELSEVKCVPCEGEAVALSEAEITDLAQELPEWKVESRGGIPQLERRFTFKNFRKALAFTNQIGELAEEAGHHPALLTEWGKVTVTWWSHSLKGLHKNDFVMAARTDKTLDNE